MKMKKAGKSTRNDENRELLKIPKKIKDQLKPLVQELLNKCSNVKSLTRKAEWDEILDISNLIKSIEKIEEKYKPKFPNRSFYLNSFYAWCSEHGAEFSSIKTNEISEGNFGAVAQRDIKENEAFLYIPRKIMMTENSARNSKLGPLISKDPILQHMPNVQIALHLLMEKLDLNSFWKPYVSILPSDFHTILYFSIEELKDLQGSPVLDGVFKICLSVARQYCYFFQLFQNDPYARSLNIGQYFTYDLYRWAVSAVMTRQNAVPSVDGQAQITALVPLFDMCNHANGKLSTDFSLEADALISYSFKRFLLDDEVCVFYGSRTNGDFFVHNGFVYSDNENDAVEIKLGISKNDSLFNLKSDLCSKLNIPLCGPFCVYKNNVMSKEMMTFLEINVMKRDELENILEKEDSLELEKISDLKQRALTFLKDRINLLLKSYKTTLEEDEAFLTSNVPESFHQTLIRQLLICEKKILGETFKYCIENSA